MTHEAGRIGPRCAIVGVVLEPEMPLSPPTQRTSRAWTTDRALRHLDEEGKAVGGSEALPDHRLVIGRVVEGTELVVAVEPQGHDSPRVVDPLQRTGRLVVRDELVRIPVEDRTDV